MKYFDEKTVFHAEELEKFVQFHYKPHRFFSDYQKTQSPLKELLIKYPNTSQQHLHKYKQALFQKLSSDEHKNASERFIDYFPEEILSDDDFHISIIRLTPYRHDYLNRLALKRPVSQKIKNWIIEECKRTSQFMSLTYPTQYNDWATRDNEFRTNLKSACEEGRKTHPRADTSMRTQETLDHVRRRTQELLMRNKEMQQRYRNR